MNWSNVVSGTCAGVVTAALMAWLARSSYRGVEFAGDSVLLSYSKVLGTFVLGFCLLCAVGCAVVSWPIVAGTPTADEIRRAVVVAPLALVLGVISFAEIRVRLAMDGVGLRGRTAFRGVRQLAWADVVEVRYSFLGHWILLRDRHGENLRVPCFLRGMRAFVTALEGKLPKRMAENAIASYRRRVGIS